MAVLLLWPWYYRFLCDDAFISFRYARNLLRGDGLVWNPGEWVEGYTNLLWVLEVAGLWALGVRPEHSSIALSWLMTAGTGVIVVLAAWRAARAEARLAVAFAALTLLATNRSVAVWATSGLETRQFTFLVSLGWLLAASWRRGAGWVAAASVALLAAELTRPEALLIGPVILGVALFDAWRRGALTPRLGAAAAVPFCAGVAAELAWRWVTYGDLVPNTFHAKQVRPWLDAGAAYWGVVSLEHALWLVVPVAVAGGVAAWRRGHRVLPLAAAAWMVPLALQLLQLGGDHFEWRPLDPYWPPLAVGAALGLDAVAVRLSGRRLPAARVSLLRGLALFVVVANGLAIPLAHDRQVANKTARKTSLRVSVTTSNSPWLWAFPFQAAWLPLYNRGTQWMAGHYIALRHQEHKVFGEYGIAGYGPFEDRTDFPPPGAISLTPAIGAYGFFMPNHVVVDKVGLTDAVIAANPVTRPNRKRMMAHDRSPPPGYIAKRGCNVEIKPIRSTAIEALALGSLAMELEPGVWIGLRSYDEPSLREAFSAWELVGRDAYRRVARPGSPPGAEEQDRFEHEGTRWTVTRWLGRFDDGLDGWVDQGPAFAGGPAPGTLLGQKDVLGFEGAGLIDSWDAVQGDKPTGSLRSPPLVVPADATLTFLVGGGESDRVGVRVEIDGVIGGTWHGTDSESLRRVVVPLGGAAGRELVIEVFDRGRRRWDHVLADSFALVREVR